MKKKVGESGVGAVRGRKGLTTAELDAVAERYANVAHRDYMHIHRGCMQAGDGVWVIYGNDGYVSDPRATKEARIVRSAAGILARKRQTSVSGIQTGGDGCTWAVAMEADQQVAEVLEAVAWAVWCEESDSRGRTRTP